MDTQLMGKLAMWMTCCFLLAACHSSPENSGKVERQATAALPANNSIPKSEVAPATSAAEIRGVNSNALLERYRATLVLSASSYWPGWEPQKAIDGNLTTSWFTQRGDAAALDTQPWIMMAFPQTVTIRRVNVMGNREPAWLHGFTVSAAKMELQDADGKVVWSHEMRGTGEASDFEFIPEKPIEGVKRVKVILRDDEGKQNSYSDVAIGEIMVE